MHVTPIEIANVALNYPSCRWRHPVFGSAPRLTEDAISGTGFPPGTEREKRKSRPAPPPGAGRTLFRTLQIAFLAYAKWPQCSGAGANAGNAAE